MTDYIGWDLGGAHLKVARLNNEGKVILARQYPCPLWHGVAELINAFPQAYAAICSSESRVAHHAVTMTGEMADCFSSRDEGVGCILVAMGKLLKQPFSVYAGEHGLVDSAVAQQMPTSVAAANWHATTTCVAAHFPQGVLIDIGSTTTDIVPFSSSKILEEIAAENWSDKVRLASGTLVYTGVVRTPIMAITDVAHVNREKFPIIAEHFANAADMYRLLGKLPQDADQYTSCDGAGKDITASALRLIRMIGDDFTGDLGFCVKLAENVASQQQVKITQAYNVLCAQHGLSKAMLIGAGVGSFLAKEVAAISAVPYCDFSTLFSAEDNHVTDYASAIALAWLLYRKVNLV